MKLFHVSEERIEIFYPRPAPEAWPGLKGQYVWAIEEQVLPNYLLPRDCPRICLRTWEGTDQKDIDSLMEGDPAPIIYVEEGWRMRIQNTALYVYHFNPVDFRLVDQSAGYWISERKQAPVHVECLDSGLMRVAALGVRIRYLRELFSLSKQIPDASLRYSMIRMRNAGNTTH